MDDFSHDAFYCGPYRSCDFQKVRKWHRSLFSSRYGVRLAWGLHPGCAGNVAGVAPVITWRSIIVLMSAGLVFGAVGASAQHRHPPQDEPIHEKFYSTWMRPDNPNLSCCSQHDCYPTEARNEGGVWFAKRREDGKWLRVPPEKVEKNRDNPDGRSHLCAPRPERAYSADIFCFTAGSGI